MINSTEKLTFQELTRSLRSVVFFALFFLYLWLRVDLRFIYHGGGVVKNFPAFYTDLTFFIKHLSYPGGIVEYITSFLAQLWYISWAGAIVTTIAAWLIYIFTDKIFKLINAGYLHLLSFTGPVLLLIIFTRYVYHFDTAMSLLASLGFVVLYLQVSVKHGKSRVSVFLLLSLILYCLGGRSYSLFAIMCCICEFFFYRRCKTGSIYLLLAFAVPYLTEGLILGIGAHDVLLTQMPVKHSSEPMHLRNQMPLIVSILYFIAPAVLVVFGTCKIIIFRIISNSKQNTKRSNSIMVFLFETFTTIILFLSAYQAIYLSYEEKSLVLKADYYACHGQWDKVLQTARQSPRSLFMIHMANRAFYHTGRLGYDMFTFPQSIDVLLLSSMAFGDPESRETAGGHWKRFGTYLDLGFLNSAQHSLVDSLEMYGERPVLLKNLAMINMAKGDLNTAKVYLGSLSKTLFHDEWAKSYMEKLESDPGLSNDTEVQKLRNIMLKKNYDLNTDKIDELFADSLQNKAAFEYMMTSYLLAHDLKSFMNNIRLLKDFDYAEIPRLYEEAILFYMFQTKKSVYLHGYKVSEATHQRFNDYMTILTRYKGDKRAAQSELTNGFGDSYLYYYLYGPLRMMK